MNKPRDHSWPIPFIRKLHGEIIPGQVITIKGIVSKKDGRFDISFMKDADELHTDTYLQISCRLGENDFALNSRRNGEYGKEERHHVNFENDEEFDIRIRAREDDFEIHSNTKKISDFKFRGPLNDINYLHIDGDIILHRASWEGQYYAIPFVGDADLTPGRRLYISGKVDDKAKDFAINVKAGHDIALHFNPRFHFIGSEIVRNTQRNGVWDETEETLGDFPFHKNHIFDIIFVCEEAEMLIYVDGQLCCTYIHRISPNKIDNIEIKGDIELQAIHF